jgi:hypothetical protein
MEQEQLLSLPNRLKKLIDLDQSLNDRITDFLDTYVDSIGSFKQQLSKVEYYYGTRKPSVCVSLSSTLSAPALPFLFEQWKRNSNTNLLRYPSVPFS